MLLVQQKKNNKNFVTVHLNSKKNGNLVIIYNLFHSSPVTYAPSMVGRFVKTSKHYLSTLGGNKKIPHMTQIDNSLWKRKDAKQSNNALTSKENPEKNDKTVTETSRVYQTKLYNQTKGRQRLAWKDDGEKITHADVINDFKIFRKATVSEHRLFSLALRGKLPFNYRKSNLDIRNRFNSGSKKKLKEKRGATNKKPEVNDGILNQYKKPLLNLKPINSKNLKLHSPKPPIKTPTKFETNVTESKFPKKKVSQFNNKKTTEKTQQKHKKELKEKNQETNNEKNKHDFE